MTIFTALHTLIAHRLRFVVATFTTLICPSTPICSSALICSSASSCYLASQVCIDHIHVLDGLRYLPLNIMMCNKMVVLIGANYSTRLWCIW